MDTGPKGAWITLISSLPHLSRGKNMLTSVRLMKKLVALELVACCFTPQHFTRGTETFPGEKLMGIK